MENVENRARQLGANLIRADTFNFQGEDFYRKLGFTQIGEYKSETDGFSEHFFIKLL